MMKEIMMMIMKLQKIMNRNDYYLAEELAYIAEQNLSEVMEQLEGSVFEKVEYEGETFYGLE